MILGRLLTAEERKNSQRNYNIFSRINGVSYMCLGENVLILFAVHLAAPNSLIAFLGSLIYFGYLVMPLGVIRTAKVGAAACQADFWVCRNIAALSIALSALIALYSPQLAWAVIVFGAFIFYGCRAAGCVLSMPLISDIASKEEIPVFVSSNTTCFYSSGVVMIIVISAILYWFEGIWSLVGVIVFGALCGITSSKFIRAMDETGAIRDAAKQKLMPGIKAAFSNKDLRKLALAWFGINLTYILIGPISVLSLKRGCGFGDTAALICAAIQFAAGSITSPLSGRISKHLGPKFLLKYCFLLYVLIPIAWCFIPVNSGASPTIPIWICAALLFFMIGTGAICMCNAATSYFLMITPDKKLQVPSSISLQLVISVGAGLIGSVLSSSIIRIAEKISVSCGSYFANDLGKFRIYFIMVLPVIILCWFAVRSLRIVIVEFRAKYGKKALEHIWESLEIRVFGVR